MLVPPLPRVLECENDVMEKNMHHLLSPLTSRSLLSFLSRWARTYLLMDPSDYSFCSKSLLVHYGKDSAGVRSCVLACICGMKPPDNKVAAR